MNPASLVLVFALLSLSCAKPSREPDPEAALDATGQTMLDPMREQALRPVELMRHLALRPTDVVADLGAGPGFLTTHLAAAVPRGRVIATDLRRDYLLVALARTERRGLHNVETRVVTADAPGLDRASVDLALLCQLDHYLADRAGYLRALAPALRAGGRVALVNYRRYREPDLEAASAAGYRVVSEWTPSPPFFLLILAPTPNLTSDGTRR